MDIKKKALIIFPDEWVCYSPTILNSIYLLSDKYKVTLVFFDNGNFKNDINNYKLDSFDSHQINVNGFLYKALSKLRAYRLFKFLTLIFFMLKQNRKSRFDIVIGIDSIGFLAGRLFYKSANFISLEVRNDFFMILSKKLGINRLIIQSFERKEFLGIGPAVKINYLQNAPIVNKKFKVKSKVRENKKLLYFGNIIRAHGVEECIKSLAVLDESYTLTLKGINKVGDSFLDYILFTYSDFIKSGRLIINLDYISQDALLDYIEDFYIGFCFYDFDVIGSDDFNYLSSPSGKLFNYIAVGLPVICNDIIGMNFIRENECGVLLALPSPENILEAIKTLDCNYQYYSRNCLKVFSMYEFETAFKMIDFD